MKDALDWIPKFSILKWKCQALFTTQSEHLQMDIERKQIVFYIQKCILTPKDLHS